MHLNLPCTRITHAPHVRSRTLQYADVTNHPTRVASNHAYEVRTRSCAVHHIFLLVCSSVLSSLRQPHRCAYMLYNIQGYKLSNIRARTNSRGHFNVQAYIRTVARAFCTSASTRMHKRACTQVQAHEHNQAPTQTSAPPISSDVLVHGISHGPHPPFANGSRLPRRVQRLPLPPPHPRPQFPPSQ